MRLKSLSVSTATTVKTMQGGIRNIKSLKQWFTDVGKPFFTLSYTGGSANQVILRNTAIDDMEAAWSLLERQVLAQSEVGRATLQLIAYGKDKANNPDGRTNIDISPNQESATALAAISGPRVGYYADESQIDALLSKERAKWDMEKRMEDLEAQLNAPSEDWSEKLMVGIERISATPLGAVLIGKFLGGSMPMPVAQVAGVPDPIPSEESDSFEDDIEASAQLLGVSDTVLASKLRALIESNPELAKTMLQ